MSFREEIEQELALIKSMRIDRVTLRGDVIVDAVLTINTDEWLPPFPEPERDLLPEWVWINVAWYLLICLVCR